MHLYRLKAHKLVLETMHDYLTEIRTTCDSLANYGRPIEEMQQTSIIPNGLKGQYENVIVVIHASKNPSDNAFVSTVLFDVESRQSYMMCVIRVFLRMLRSTTLQLL